MDIYDIILSIDNSFDEPTNRCISYCEVILFLEELKKNSGFRETEIPWKDTILKRLKADIDGELEKKILELKKVIDLNVKGKM